MDEVNTPKTHATPDCFRCWEEKAKKMSASTLSFAIKDCLEAADCADSMGKHIQSGRYLDEAWTYMKALKTR